MLFGILFPAWLAYETNLAAIIFSATQKPVDVSVEQIENGEMPYQLNWNLSGFRPAVGSGIPVFWERRDGQNQEFRGFYLPLVSDQQKPDDATQRPVVILEANLDFIEQRKFTPLNRASSEIVDLASLGQLSGHRSLNPTPVSMLELEKLQEFYPGYSADDFVVFTANDSLEEALISRAGICGGISCFFFIVFGLAARVHWRKYLTESRLESKLDNGEFCQHDNCKLAIQFIKQQTDDFGATFIEPFELASPKQEAKLHPFVCLMLLLVSFAAFLSIIVAITYLVDTLLKAVAAGLALLLVYRFFRRVWGYLSRREPKELEAWFPQPKLPVAESAFYRHHSKVLDSLGFTMIGESATRHFFACPNRRLLAMVGVKRGSKERQPENYFSLISVLEGGEVVQTTSLPKNIYNRSLHQPDWFVNPADDSSLCQAIEKHRDAINAMQSKHRHDQFAITEYNYTKVVQHIDRLYETAWSSMMENTWFAI